MDNSLFYEKVANLYGFHLNQILKKKHINSTSDPGKNVRYMFKEDGLYKKGVKNGGDRSYKKSTLRFNDCHADFFKKAKVGTWNQLLEVERELTIYSALYSFENEMYRGVKDELLKEFSNKIEDKTNYTPHEIIMSAADMRETTPPSDDFIRLYASYLGLDLYEIFELKSGFNNFVYRFTETELQFSDKSQISWERASTAFNVLNPPKIEKIKVQKYPLGLPYYYPDLLKGYGTKIYKADEMDSEIIGKLGYYPTKEEAIEATSGLLKSVNNG